MDAIFSYSLRNELFFKSNNHQLSKKTGLVI